MTYKRCRNCEHWEYLRGEIGKCNVLTKKQRQYNSIAPDFITWPFFCCYYFKGNPIQHRIDNLELRQIELNRCEIVLWNSCNMPTNCATIAYWIKENVFWNLRFVSSRPFGDDVSKDDFWKLAKMGQDYLDKKDG